MMVFNKKKVVSGTKKETVENAELLSEKEAEEEAYSNVPTENSDDVIIDEDLDKKKEEVSKDMPESFTKEVPSEDESSFTKDDEEEKPEPLITGEMNLKQASELAKKKLSEALNKPANATISIENEGDHWFAMVEIVEEEYLPGQNLKSMNDLLGVYEINLSNQGELLKWTRKKSYKRAEIK
jgi:hypothetical protein